MKTETKTLSSAMYELAKTIHSEDGVANSAIEEAAQRLDEQTIEILRLKTQLVAAENSIEYLTGPIPIEQQRDLLIYAFRYVMGRCSYAPHTVICVIRNSWKMLSNHDKKLIQREIREAIERDNAGMDYDKQAWATLLELPL